MSIKSTQYITRESAVERIKKINDLVLNKDFRELERVSSEHSDYRIDFVLQDLTFPDIEHIEKWTNRMLEDVMDNPVYRFSMFDNYLIEKE